MLLIFGTKKLRNVGGDLGSAIRDFRKGVSEGDKESADDSSMKSESASEDNNKSSSS